MRNWDVSVPIPVLATEVNSSELTNIRKTGQNFFLLGELGCAAPDAIETEELTDTATHLEKTRVRKPTVRYI